MEKDSINICDVKIYNKHLLKDLINTGNVKTLQ